MLKTVGESIENHLYGKIADVPWAYLKPNNGDTKNIGDYQFSNLKLPEHPFIIEHIMIGYDPCYISVESSRTEHKEGYGLIHPFERQMRCF